MDNSRRFSVPYFLTANHCVATGTVGSSVEAWWFFQRASCGGTALDPRHPATTVGTDLLATNASHDLTLLRFRNTSPGGTALSGWSHMDLDHPVDAYGIHHPNGEEKKYSAGTSVGNFYSDGVVNAIAVTWSEGATEGGSSGSGLFLKIRRLSGRWPLPRPGPRPRHERRRVSGTDEAPAWEAIAAEVDAWLEREERLG